MVGETVAFFFCEAFWGPFLDDLVEVLLACELCPGVLCHGTDLIVMDRYRLVHVVADRLALAVSELLFH